MPVRGYRWDTHLHIHNEYWIRMVDGNSQWFGCLVIGSGGSSALAYVMKVRSQGFEDGSSAVFPATT